MKISIQVPVYNVEKYVIPCLRSIMADMDDDCELLVVDDCSSDNTPALIKDFASTDTRIRLETNPQNLGIAMTRRKMVDITDAEYIVPFDADDLFIPGRLKRHADFLDQHPGHAAIYGKTVLWDEETGKVRYYTGRPYSNFLIFDANPAGHGGCMIRRRSLLAAGNYMKPQHEGKQLNVACDYFMWQRLGIVGDIGFDNNFTYLYRTREGQITWTKTEQYQIAHDYIMKYFHDTYRELIQNVVDGEMSVNFPNKNILMQIFGWLLLHVHNNHDRLSILTNALKIYKDDFGCYVRLFDYYAMNNEWDNAEAVSHMTAERFKDNPFAIKTSLEMKIRAMTAKGEDEEKIGPFREHLEACKSMTIMITDTTSIINVLKSADGVFCHETATEVFHLPRLMVLSRADVCGVDEHIRKVDGDHWFSTHLKKALSTTGVDVVDRLCDAEALLYLHGITPPEILNGFKGYKMIWLHSHPDQVTREMLSGFNRIYSLSPLYIEKIRAMGLDAEPLIGATAFSVPLESFNPVERILFVGNRRKTGRPIIRDILSLGDKWRSRLDVYGPGWSKEELGECYKGFGIDNTNLNKCYNAYTVILNDHHEDMRREGFLNPRILDVMATGGLVISDDLAGHEMIFGDALLTYRSPAEMDQLLEKIFTDNEFRRKMVRKGRKAVAGYMFANVAETLRNCLEKQFQR